MNNLADFGSQFKCGDCGRKTSRVVQVGKRWLCDNCLKELDDGGAK